MKLTIKSLAPDTINRYFLMSILLTILTYVVIYVLDLSLDFSSLIPTGFLPVEHVVKFLMNNVVEKFLKRGIEDISFWLE
jgi:hypothetical protein